MVTADSAVEIPTICAARTGRRSYLSANIAEFAAVGTDAMTAAKTRNASPKKRSAPTSLPINITTSGFTRRRTKAE